MPGKVASGQIPGWLPNQPAPAAGPQISPTPLVNYNMDAMRGSLQPRLQPFGQQTQAQPQIPTNNPYIMDVDGKQTAGPGMPSNIPGKQYQPGQMPTNILGGQGSILRPEALQRPTSNTTMRPDWMMAPAGAPQPMDWPKDKLWAPGTKSHGMPVGGGLSQSGGGMPGGRMVSSFADRP